MTKSKRQRLFAALLITALLTAMVASAAVAAVPAAVSQQEMGASEATGIIPGGEFAKIWLGLTPKEPGTVTVRAEWDRNNVDSNAVGFYVLDESNLSSVLSGNPVRENNIAAGSQTFYLNGPDNTQGAAFRAVGPAYTVVIFNDSNSDASFSLSVENGTLSDDSDQVTLVGVATEEATETPAADGADTEGTATAEVDATEAATPAATLEATAVATATVAAIPAGPLRAQEVEGELPEQYNQHLLGLEPSIRDGEVTLVLTFDPQDSSELARRINFWVLDAAGLRAYQEGESASSVAIAAGSREEGNTRTGTFTSAGLGPYTVIVYNNSMVPATYGLRVDGGVLIDDSNQTLTAQEAGAVATPIAATDAEAGEDTTTAPATTTTTTTTTTEAGGREGEPGGTYTVQSGDTLALIARDIYGDYRVYEQICSLNDIADCNVIEVGQVLQLPTEAEAGASVTTTTTTATTTEATATAMAEETEEATATETVTATTTLTSTGTTTGTTTAGTTSSTTTSSTSAGGTIVDVAADNANFTTLVAALQETGLDEALSGNGPYTVFAPTDAAFDALLTGNGLTVDQLLRARELPDILQYHVLSSKLLAADITDGLQATTLEGKPVTFEVRDGKVFINGAEIITTDVEGSNGVIHGIDAVILPPQ